MRAFKERRGAFVARVGRDEREVLASLVADVVELLGGVRLEDLDRADVDALVAGGDGAPRLRTSPVPAPDDPAVRRLLPDASREDPQVAAEFRRLTEDDLRARKLARLARLWSDLSDPAADDALRVPLDRAPEVAATLTDVRLVVAERLGVTTDDDAERLYEEATRPGADAARHYLVSVYAALTWLQESLVTLMLERHRRGDGGD